MNKKLIEELQSLIKNKPEEVPEGWYTTPQIKKFLSRSLSQTQAIMKHLITNFPSRVQTKKFRITDRAGRTQQTTHYKIK